MLYFFWKPINFKQQKTVNAFSQKIKNIIGNALFRNSGFMSLEET